MFTQIQEFYIYEFVKNKIVNLHSESFFNSFLNFSQFYKLLLTLFFETSECFSSGHKYYAIFFFSGTRSVLLSFCMTRCVTTSGQWRTCWNCHEFALLPVWIVLLWNNLCNLFFTPVCNGLKSLQLYLKLNANVRMLSCSCLAGVLFSVFANQHLT